MRAGLEQLVGDAGQRASLLAHGTTVATNAVLEGRLARTALVTTEGLADVIEIGRQDRPSLYDQFADRPPPLVARDLRFEVRERLAADGSELTPVDLDALPVLPDDVEAVAVCLLHADLDPAHEQAVAVGAARAGAWTWSPPTRCRRSSASTSAPSPRWSNAGLRPPVPDLPAAAHRSGRRGARS